MLLVIVLSTITNCRRDKGMIDHTASGYPQEIGKIILNKCATSGCHNDQSKGAVGGLSLVSWDKMFEGSGGGSVVIPYRPDYSTLIYYTNSYDEFGTIQLVPKMPIDNAPLTREEMNTLYSWIKEGAPNAQGFVKFSDDPNRKKFYVSNQGCDVVTTFDAQSFLAMRVTSVGKGPQIEAPHFIKVSPDNKYWYVSFLGAAVFQKYKVSDNSFVGEAYLGLGSWNTFALSSDGKFAYAINWTSNGMVKIIKTDSMIVKATLPGLNWSHGSALNQTNDTLYVTSQTSNYIFKIATDFTDAQQIVLDNSGLPINTTYYDPHEILMSPNYSKYFVSCQKTNEVRVMDRKTDQLITAIPVGDFPQEMAISKSKNYLFVTCMEDITTFGPEKRGSVYVIDINSNVIINKVYTGHQPHGIMVDEKNNRVYITNRNVVSGGPSPHHASLCAGNNGYVTAIDLNTLKLVPGFKAEVSVDPYGYSITH